MHSRITQLLKKIAVKTTHTTVNRGSRNYSNKSLFDGIFRHTFKKIPPRYAESGIVDPYALVALREAISTGDHGAEIFSDPECSTHLLHLIRNDVIPFWQGITVYAYLMGLMQFTHKQPLFASDVALKDMPHQPVIFKI